VKLIGYLSFTVCVGRGRDKSNLSDISYFRSNWSNLSPLTQKSS